MAVAQLRGVKFEQKHGGYWQPANHQQQEYPALAALFDVVGFFGFGSDLTNYLSTMRRIGGRIRERVKEGGQE